MLSFTATRSWAGRSAASVKDISRTEEFRADLAWVAVLTVTCLFLLIAFYVANTSVRSMPCVSLHTSTVGQPTDRSFIKEKTR